MSTTRATRLLAVAAPESSDPSEDCRLPAAALTQPQAAIHFLGGINRINRMRMKTHRGDAERRHDEALATTGTRTPTDEATLMPATFLRKSGNRFTPAYKSVAPHTNLCARRLTIGQTAAFQLQDGGSRKRRCNRSCAC